MPMKKTKITPGCAYPLGATPLAGGVNFSVFANKAEAREGADPYGRAVAMPATYIPGDNAATAMKSVVVDSAAYDWEGDRPLRRSFAETVIYEMHVRGFTRRPNSGVTPERRGSYVGLSEKIPHLQYLGITAVELLPVYHFDPFTAPAGMVNYTLPALLQKVQIEFGGVTPSVLDDGY